MTEDGTLKKWTWPLLARTVHIVPISSRSVKVLCTQIDISELFWFKSQSHSTWLLFPKSRSRLQNHFWRFVVVSCWKQYPGPTQVTRLLTVFFWICFLINEVGHFKLGMFCCCRAQPKSKYIYKCILCSSSGGSPSINRSTHIFRSKVAVFLLDVEAFFFFFFALVYNRVACL